MRIYIIGPVSGFDDLNLPAFEAAYEKLRAAGYKPLIPHDFVRGETDWQNAMRRSLETLAKADGVAYLDGWKQSKSATLEWHIARALGIDVAAVDSWCAVSERKEAMAERMGKRKQCPRCKRILPVTLFDPSSDNVDKLQGYCRGCMVDYKRDRRTT